MGRMMVMVVVVVVAVVLQFSSIQVTECQQSYVNNKQLDCEKNFTEAWGYVCNGPSPSCTSYITFRSSDPTYNSPATIGFLLSTDPTDIFLVNQHNNNISSDVASIPSDTLVIVPVNCSCSRGDGSNPQQQQYYQHNASYVLKTELETYFTVANNTYQGLTTCQSMKAQNPNFNFLNLDVGMKLTVPLRCACPTSNQSASGFKYLLSYLVTWGDDISSIAQRYGGLDAQTIYDANQISSDTIIFPFTPILVPLKTEPNNIRITNNSPPPPPPQTQSSPPTIPGGGSSNSTRKWVFVGVGVGSAAFLLLLGGFLVWFLHGRHPRRPSPKEEGPTMVVSQLPPPTGMKLSPDYSTLTALEEDSGSKSQSVSAKGVRDAIEFLTIYKFQDLEKATGYFSETNRVKQGSSLYRGLFKGDEAAVKIMKGDVSNEINILKQINHSNIIRLSGFCVHQGNTYLVYEFAEKGSLDDWLQQQQQHTKNKTPTPITPVLGWRQRVQFAYDVADALNYLHNYANPPYIHKNLKTSNILLDANFRAKIANFGLARTLENPTAQGVEGEEGLQQMQLTRHVVGTYGYMAPEYIENGLVTPKLDVFAFGVVMLELLSAREAGTRSSDKKHGADNGKDLLSATINQVLGGDNVREKLRAFMDPCLKNEYPLDLAYSMAQLAQNCVAHDLNSRPPMSEVLMTLSKILSSSLDWDPSDEFERSTSLTLGR